MQPVTVKIELSGKSSANGPAEGCRVDLAPRSSAIEELDMSVAAVALPFRQLFSNTTGIGQHASALLDEAAAQLVFRAHPECTEVKLHLPATLHPRKHAQDSRFPAGSPCGMLKSKIPTSTHLLHAKVHREREMAHPICHAVVDLSHQHPLKIPTKVQRTKRVTDRANHDQVGLVPLEELHGLKSLGRIVEIPGLPVIGVRRTQIQRPSGINSELG